MTLQRWHQYADQRFIVDEAGNHLCATPSPDAAARLVAEHNALIECAKVLEAIRARVLGDYDNPSLMTMGLLSTDTRGDIEHWCDVALANLENTQ